MESIGGIKVFRMTNAEYWAGRTLEECIEDYRFEYGDDEDEMLDEPAEVTDEDLDKLRFTEDVDGEASEDTFRQRLEEMVRDGEHFPTLFATTEI